MSDLTDLKDEVRKTFVPFAEARGFEVMPKRHPLFIEFRRATGKTLELFDVQWDKRHRPQFTVNFGRAKLEEAAAAGQSFCASLAREYGRVHPGDELAEWFHLNKTFLQWMTSGRRQYKPSEIVDRLVQLFPEIETFWKTGSVGPHLELLSRGPNRDD
jgi:hypothetical protein